MSRPASPTAVEVQLSPTLTSARPSADSPSPSSSQAPVSPPPTAVESVPLPPASPHWQSQARDYLRTHNVEGYPPPLRPASPQWQREAVEYCRMHVEPFDIPIVEISSAHDLPPSTREQRVPLSHRLRAARRTVHEKRLYLHRAMQSCEDGFSSDGSTPGQNMQGYYDQLSQWDDDLEALIRVDSDNDRRSVEIQDLVQALTAALLQLNHLRSQGEDPPAPAPRVLADWW